MKIGDRSEIKRVSDAVQQGFRDADAVCVDRGLFEDMVGAIAMFMASDDDGQELWDLILESKLLDRIYEQHPRVSTARTAEEG